MTTTTTQKTQIRGICQCCGRQQAVVSTGCMSKHGYTVEQGWFNGTCNGHAFAPMQVSRDEADRIVSVVRKDCTDLRRRSAQAKAGKIHPDTVTTGRWDSVARKAETIPYADATPRQQADACRTLAFQLQQRADMGDAFADQLTARADQYHGTELLVVPVDAGPAPVRCGDVRQSARGPATVTAVDGATIYWKLASGLKGRMSSRRWRALPAADAVQA